MRWRVLGPVEVAVNGREAPLRRPQQRAVLAYLLLNANRVVPAAQLVDALWGATPPRTAPAQVHACLSHLRGALREVNAVDALAKHAGGYRLTVDGGDLDVARFAVLTTQADDAYARESWAEVSGMLREALGLWRGTPLTGAAGAFVANAVTALEEQRLSAYERLADAELSLGRHTALVAELGELADAHPLRERLAAQLMLALAGSGLQTQALQRYARLRDRLADELGVEPGPEVTAAHLRVLRQEVPAPREPSAVEHTNAPPTTALSRLVPQQLPRQVPVFVGRDSTMAALDALWRSHHEDPSGEILLITGTAGVGKTALAVRWAHRVRQRFPDGQLYLNLQGFDPTGQVLSVTEAIRGLLDAFESPPERIPQTTAAQVGLYRSLLADRRVLVVLDNARDAEQVRPLLPGAPGCLVVVTSRNRLTGLVTGEGARPFPLEPLTTTQAQELLSRRLGDCRTTTDHHDRDQIVAACAGLPLALSIAAARAATAPRPGLGALVDQLTQAHHRLEAFTGDDPATDIRAVFSWSYHALTPEAGRLFRLLGLHPVPSISVTCAASLAGIPKYQARSRLTELARANLVDEHTPGRYALHDLLHSYARELAHSLDSDEARQAALHRMFDHYLHSTRGVVSSAHPWYDPIAVPAPRQGTTCEPVPDEPLRWLAAERPTLVVMVEHAAVTEFHAHAWQLASALAPALQTGRRWVEWIATQQVALDSARRLGQGSWHAGSLRQLGLACGRLGRYEDAHSHLKQALALFQSLGDDPGRAHVHRYVAVVLGMQGRYREAIVEAQRCLEVYQNAHNLAGQAGALNAIGWYYFRLGDYHQTLVRSGRALVLYETLGSRSIGDPMNSLAHAYQRLGELRKALAFHRRAADVYLANGATLAGIESLVSLGDLNAAMGRDDEAGDAWRRALPLLDQHEDPRAADLRIKIENLHRDQHE